MTGDVAHPAVTRLLAELPLPGLVVFVVAERDNVVAAVVDNDTGRRVVLVERVGNEWVVPTMISGTRKPADTRREARTDGPKALWQRRISRSGQPGPDGGPPAVGWCAVTGIAAQDAREVHIYSEVDEVVAPIREDGFVLGVLRAPWHAKPTITVRTLDGRPVVDQYP